MEFRFRFRTDHGLMHRVQAKVNAAGPFHTAEIGIDGDGVENARVQQFQKHTAASFGFNRKIPLTPSLKVTCNRYCGSGSAEMIRIMVLYYSNGAILEGG
jgi:hypothetical protein